MEYLDGSRGLLSAFLGWLLVVYPLLTLPVFLRLLFLTEDEPQRTPRQEPGEADPRLAGRFCEGRDPARHPVDRRLEARRWRETAELDEPWPGEERLPPAAVAHREPPRPDHGVRRLRDLRERNQGRRPGPPPGDPLPPEAAEPSAGHREYRRLREAARRVTESRDLDRWIRRAAQEYLEKTGTDDGW